MRDVDLSCKRMDNDVMWNRMWAFMCTRVEQALIKTMPKWVESIVADEVEGPLIFEILHIIVDKYFPDKHAYWKRMLASMIRDKSIYVIWKQWIQSMIANKSTIVADPVRTKQNKPIANPALIKTISIWADIINANDIDGTVIYRILQTIIDKLDPGNGEYWTEELRRAVAIPHTIEAFLEKRRQERANEDGVKLNFVQPK